MNIEDKHHITSCLKTDLSVKPTLKRFWSLLLFPVIGLVALIWFLVRVIPKPTRATYPCQRVAAPLASGFILWAVGAIASVTALRKAKQYFLRHRYFISVLCLLISISFSPVILKGWHEKVAQADQYDYTYVDPVHNSPIGIARGIYPGHVIWVHNRDATDWNGPGYGHWWENSHTDQEEVDDIVSLALRAVTGAASDTEAWDMLFKHFNGNETGYLAGEKIMVKLNLVGTHFGKYNVDKTTGEQTSLLDYTNTSPQMMMALLKQLVYNAGVNPSDILVGDPTANIPNQYWDPIIQEFGSGKVTVIDHHEYLGRTAAAKSTTAHIYWSGTAKSEGVAACFEEATYVINFACLKAHTDAGITVCGKNHYGSLVRTPGPFQEWSGDTYLNLHQHLPTSQGSGYDATGMGRYRPQVDLMGCQHYDGKGLLWLIDGLYGGWKENGDPEKWDLPPFNNDWPSSLFVSQDPVAIDSVAFDFLWEQWDFSDTDDSGRYNHHCPHLIGAEDYLHEAALADTPPSGTAYDPDNDGTGLPSLGVHEHWNNPKDKKYSRNLGIGNGIEFIKVPKLQVQHVGGDTCRLSWLPAGNYRLEFDTSPSFNSPVTLVEVTDTSSHYYCDTGDTANGFFRLLTR